MEIQKNILALSSPGEIGIKNIFEKLGIFIEDNKLLICIIAVFFIIIAIHGAQNIEMETGTETFADKNSRLYQDFEHLYLNIFSKPTIPVMVEGGDEISPGILNAIDRYQTLVENIPGVEGTDSVASVVKEIHFEEHGRYDIPSDREVIKSYLEKNNAGETTVPQKDVNIVYITLDRNLDDAELREINEKIMDSISLAQFPPGYTVTVTGFTTFNIAVEDLMNETTAILLVVSGIFMIIALYAVFRHVRWRILPLPLVFLGIIYTFGLMGYTEIPLTTASMAAFPILIGLGIDYAIQFHSRIEEEFSRSDNEAVAVIETIKHTGPAVLIALIITSLGFASLLTSTVPMIQDFAKLLLIGITVCFLTSLFVGVSIIYGLHRIRRRRHEFAKKYNLTFLIRNSENKSNDGEKAENENLVKLLRGTSKITSKHPILIISVAGILCIGGLYADFLVPLEADMRTFVPQDMPELAELNRLDTYIGVEDSINLIVMSDNNANPELLKWIDDFESHMVDRRSHIHSSSSIVDIVKAENDGKIPESSSEIKEIYSQLSDSQKEMYVYEETLLHVNLNIGDAFGTIGIEGMEDVVEMVEYDLMWIPPPPGVHITATGDPVIFTEVIFALTSGRTLMTLFGLLLVFFGLLVIYRDIVKAVAPVITMLAVIGWNGGVMYYTGIEYTPMTATLGALILGIGSEYAILMMERYYEEKEKGLAHVEAMNEAITKIGKAIATSGFTTMFGFSALLASPFPMNQNFGLVTVIDVGLALMATFVVFPAVILLLDQWRDKRSERKKINLNNCV